MELRTEVKCFTVKMMCDECFSGQMLSTGLVLTSYPALYTHVCTLCSHQDNYNNVYPKVEYSEC